MTFSKLAVFLTLVALTICAGCDSTQSSAKLDRDVGTVALEIDFGGEKRSKSIDVVCSPDSTVLSTLQRAENTGELKIEFSGSGETAFVNSIDGVKNDGDGSNWTYRVNDDLGDKSAGVFPVGPGDRISWTFGAKPEELD
ncbi:DUF4430 domain-containing protein [Mariniblastus fucicola]|uniref:Transcobalamin-like C-terminal domain-containing protein n=1 Tax=Mariniblastus fucicola TaxID=980251 RepID=A0A5B9P3T0_9BACT|nr:DUF4430 domain-containing protein [Mariniblastus fucicola]QEG20864.1 hypothetical protein MFFC18_07150 [Mariniblastus fucicola]